METATLEANTQTVDLSNLVGLISVRGTTRIASASFVDDLQHWIDRNGWAQHLRVNLELGHDDVEVTFIPGENQSNPQVQFTFREMPEFSRIQFRLMHWLYELM